MTELVTFGETALRFSTPGHERLATADRADIYVDGVESNVAVAAGCLGAESCWLSTLPDTPVGHRVVGTLRGHGIDTEVAWRDEGRVGTVYHEAGAAPRDDGWWHDRADASAALTTPGDVPMDLVQSADVVFSGMSTPGLSESAAETTEAMLRAGGGGGAVTAVDLDYDPARHDPDFLRQLLERLVRHVDVLVVNEDDARTVLDLSGGAREVANTVVAEYELEMAVVTRSTFGAVVMHDTPGTNVVHERDALESDGVDATGTREAFVGGFLARLGAGAEAAEALDYGVATAAMARTVPGPLLTADRGEIDPLADRVHADAR